MGQEEEERKKKSIKSINQLEEVPGVCLSVVYLVAGEVGLLEGEGERGRMVERASAKVPVLRIPRRRLGGSACNVLYGTARYRRPEALRLGLPRERDRAVGML